MPHKDPVIRAAYMKEYKARPAEAARRRHDRPLWDSAKHANERAEKYGCVGVLKMADIKAIYEQCNNVCVYCGGSYLLGLDHVEPLHAGGTNTPDNCVVACRSCNASKWRGDAPYQWAREWTCCRECGTTERRHWSRGYCSACYQRIHLRRVSGGRLSVNEASA